MTFFSSALRGLMPIPTSLNYFSFSFFGGALAFSDRSRCLLMVSSFFFSGLATLVGESFHSSGRSCFLGDRVLLLVEPILCLWSRSYHALANSSFSMRRSHVRSLFLLPSMRLNLMLSYAPFTTMLLMLVSRTVVFGF